MSSEYVSSVQQVNTQSVAIVGLINDSLGIAKLAGNLVVGIDYLQDTYQKEEQNVKGLIHFLQTPFFSGWCCVQLHGQGY